MTNTHFIGKFFTALKFKTGFVSVIYTCYAVSMTLGFSNDDDVLELIYDYGYDVEQIACQLKSDINLVNMKTEILRYKGYDLRQGEFRSNFLK